MADASDPLGGEIEVTPQERRFLKRFFRRQILPWALALTVISVTSAWWMGGEDPAQVEARAAAALAQLRTENQRLRAEFGALSERVQSVARSDRGDELEQRVEDAKRSVRLIESRVAAALEQRLDRLEARLAEGPSVPTAGSVVGPPPEAAAWDVSAILDRLYALEMREEQGGGDPRAAQRLLRLEERVARLEQDLSAIPAAPARP